MLPFASIQNIAHIVLSNKRAGAYNRFMEEDYSTSFILNKEFIYIRGTKISAIF